MNAPAYERDLNRALIAVLTRSTAWMRRHAWLKRYTKEHPTFNGKACWRCEAEEIATEADAVLATSGDSAR